MAELKKLNKN